MSPISLIDLAASSRSQSPESASSSEHEPYLEQRAESTYPRSDGNWAIGDEKNEPIAIVGIGMSLRHERPDNL